MEEEDLITTEAPASSTQQSQEQPGARAGAHDQGPEHAEDTQQGQVLAPAQHEAAAEQAQTTSSSSGPTGAAVGTVGPQHDIGAATDADAPAAAQQIGQLQAELAAVRQSLATYESTLQLLVSELGTQQGLPAVLQQLQQQRPQHAGLQQQQQQLAGVPALQSQAQAPHADYTLSMRSQQQLAAEGTAQPAEPHLGLHTLPGSSSTGTASMQAVGTAPAGSASEQHGISAAEAGSPPAASSTAAAQQGQLQQEQQQDPPGRQPSLQHWSQQEASQSGQHSSQDLTASTDDPAELMWQQQQQQWQQVPSAPLYSDAAAGFGSLYQQTPLPPLQPHQQMGIQHSAPVPISGQLRAQLPGVATTPAVQLGSSFGSALGPFGTAFAAGEDPVTLGTAAASGGPHSLGAPGSRMSASPGLQQAPHHSHSPQRALDTAASAGPALSDSGGSFDFLRQGFKGLVARRSVPGEGQLQGSSVGSLQPGQRPAGLQVPLAPRTGSSRQAGSDPGGAAASPDAPDFSLRSDSGTGTSVAAATAALANSLSQSQHLSYSMGPSGGQASPLGVGSGLTLPVLAQGAQMMGLLPPLPGSTAGGSSRQGQGPSSAGMSAEDVEAVSGLLMQASSSAVGSGPVQQPLPPPGIIHHLLTDTAGSLDLMSSLSHGTAATAGGYGLPGGSAAAAAAAAAAANFTGSFGSAEHSIGGSFGMLSGGLSGQLPLGGSLHGPAGGYDRGEDAVPGSSRSLDQYSTQQLAALQGLVQQQASTSSQDAAAAAAASGMDPMAVLQQLQAQALLAAASAQHTPSQELLPGFAASAEQQQMLAAALAQLGIKDAAAAAAAAAAATAGRGGNPGVAAMDPAAALAAAAAAAAAAGMEHSQGVGAQAQQLAQMQAALASLNLQAQAQVELQALQQAQLVQQLQQHYNAQQLLVAQAAAAAAAATAIRQGGSSSSWHGDRRLSNAIAAGKLLAGHGSGGSTGSSGGRRSSRGGDALGSGARDSRKASSTGERTGRAANAPPDWRRVFVGNIGWWVDEDMLHRVFGEYGTILDAQVMWNTKLLAKGKHVNREFAFISYSNPDEAGRAIRGMHGRYIEGLTKDRDGLTVQYEAQGVGKPAPQQGYPSPQQQQQQGGGFAPPPATQQHFLLHQLQQSQQQQQQSALQMLLQQSSDQPGSAMQSGEVLQPQHQLQQQQQQQQGAGSSSSRFSAAGSSSELQQRPPGSPL